MPEVGQQPAAIQLASLLYYFPYSELDIKYFFY